SSATKAVDRSGRGHGSRAFQKQSFSGASDLARPSGVPRPQSLGGSAARIFDEPRHYRFSRDRHWPKPVDLSVGAMAALGPARVKTCASQESVEQFSLLASSNSRRQNFWFSD